MMHSPIQLQDIALSYPHKICFEELNTQLHHGSRIAIIGENGCGKSTLLKIVQGSVEPTSGTIKIPGNVRIGYVPQVIDCFKNLSGGQHKRQALSVRLADLCLPEIINPKFSLSAQETGSRVLVAISAASVGYSDKTLLHNFSLSIAAQERIAIMGDNGSGKSTLIKAILNDEKITKSGNWYMPEPQDIGYLDQHYATLNPHKSVLETIQELAPTKNQADIRYHLNDFLFPKNEEVYALVSTLSGGEKARLTLAQIAAKTPKLLILDEVTNNLDLKTRDYVIQVLQNYPGAMIVISHDEDFLQAIKITDSYFIKNYQ